MKGLSEFPYDDHALVTIEKYISPERLAAYVQHARGDKWVAHHERLVFDRQKLEQNYDEILETIGWINPTIRLWAESTNCFQMRLNKPLPKKPKPIPTIFT